MDFDLSEEHELLKNTVHEFSKNELRPYAAEVDRTGEFPSVQVKKMAELGLMGVSIPEEYGGAGMDVLSYVIAVEELAWGDASCAVIMSVNNSLVCDAIYKKGNEYLKKNYLPKLASGEELGCFCLTEAEAGSDAGNQKTKAVRDGDDYIINGSKMFITSGGHADKALVVTVTDPEKGKKGISSFMVDTHLDGFTFGPPEKKLGIHGSHTTEVHLKDLRVPAQNMLGEEGDGLRVALGTLDSGRIGIAAQALGIGRAALEESVKYSKEREQFGKPICKFQDIQFKLADMATELDAARLLVHRAAWLKSMDKVFTREVAMAKLKASEVCNMICTEAIQIHGGYGYIKEFAVERHFRDGRITEIYEGTSEVQRIVIARDLLKD
jgi:alkylation response protein AidB-like acyl-CoA dehydrogenase